DLRVVEARIHMRDARGDVLALAAAYARALLLCRCFFAHFNSLGPLAGRSTPGRDLLAGDRALRLALGGAGDGVRALSMYRQVLTVPEAAVAAEIHQPLDVDRDLAAQVAFHEIVAVDLLADLQNFGVGELTHAAVERNVQRGHDVMRALLA